MFRSILPVRNVKVREVLSVTASMQGSLSGSYAGMATGATKTNADIIHLILHSLLPWLIWHRFHACGIRIILTPSVGLPNDISAISHFRFNFKNAHIYIFILHLLRITSVAQF